MMSSYSTEDARLICEMADLWWGGHFVLCRVDNKAPAMPWKQFRPTAGDIWNHIHGGGLAGVVPFSIGYTVVDVDNGPPLAMAFAATPACVTASRTPGNGHLWYPDDAPRPNRKWQFYNLSGEIRSGHGYVVLWPGAARNLIYNPASDALTYRQASDIFWPDGGDHQIAQAAMPEPSVAEPDAANRRRVMAPYENRDRIKHALYSQTRYSPDPHDDWIAVGMALHEGAIRGDLPLEDAFLLWCEWSAGSAKYRLAECETRWRSFGNYPDKRITPASLFV